MNSFGYYVSGKNDGEFPYNESSRVRSDYPLAINCAGVISTDVPFVTNNPTGREDYYLLYVVEGKLTVHMPERICNAAPFDAFIFPPGYRYKYSYSGGNPIRYYWLHFPAVILMSDFGNLALILYRFI